MHRAERADRLVAALADVLADPLDDPFATEVVAVHSRGTERWLAQSLSATLGATPGHADGVCANITFPFPRRLIGDAIAAATGIDPTTDPWLADRTTWTLLDVISRFATASWLAPVIAHIGDDAHGHRLAVVTRIARLFDHYGVHRPDMVTAWASGRDLDARGQVIASDDRWQPELWRHLRERIAVPSPAERVLPAAARLADAPDALDLPARLALFGVTRLPPAHAAILQALGPHRDIHLLVLHPSPALWDRVAPTAPAGTLLRDAAPSAATGTNPLVRSWGRDTRELQLVLAPAGATEHHHTDDIATTTLLGRIQTDVRADRRPPGPPPPGGDDLRHGLKPDDRSVQVHACHGRARQVEVLRDAVLHLLADDPTLEPRDVIVLCPDVEAFAPLIHATFGDGWAVTDDPHVPDLRVRVADRALRRTNPLLDVVAEVLDLADARLSAAQVADLASRAPVRRRFGFDDDDLARIEGWVAATGIRWGLDAPHRLPWRVEGTAVGTWSAGLDRLLVGAACEERSLQLVGGVLGLDDVDSTDIDLVGRLAELVARLGRAVDRLTPDQAIADWAAAIAEVTDMLATPARSASWQRAQLHELLDDIVAEAGDTDATAHLPLRLAEVRALMSDRLRGRPTRASFRTGHLTVCTLTPMRTVPHRVVCLLGLDDGAFPRHDGIDGDDLVARAPQVGDRDVGGEDRQLLLDAVMATGDHLVITYEGHDERSNVERPPAVPLGELLDVIDATVRHPSRGASARARDQITVHHPLQPTDVAAFTPGALIADRPWSTDRVALAGARASVAGRAEPPPFLAGRLDSGTGDAIALDDLVAFVTHPVRAFLRQRLGVVTTDARAAPPDAIPIQPDGLARWAVGDRILATLRDGADADAASAAEVARGHLPPGPLGAAVLEQTVPVAEQLAARAGALTGGVEAAPLEVAVELSDATVAGTVTDLHGDLLCTVRWSRLSPAHRLAAWVRLLLVTAAHPDRTLHAAMLGTGRNSRIRASLLAPLADDAVERRTTAVAHLEVLVDLYRRGMREPLPVFSRTSAAWAEARRTDAVPYDAADEQWAPPPWITAELTGEGAAPEHVVVHGGVADLTDVLGAPAPDETGPGWAADETTRLGRLARRLWDPVLDHEAWG